jgi:hypothetical protein
VVERLPLTHSRRLKQLLMHCAAHISKPARCAERVVIFVTKWFETDKAVTELRRRDTVRN